MAGFFQRHSNVLLYVPNLIGYLRVACAFYAFAVAFKNPYHFVISYFFSFVCDELDGRFARMLNQTSTLGAVLDMVTDRLATTGLLVILAMQYPDYHVACILLIFLDIFSHWFQMYSSLAMGAATHKDVKSRSWLVRTYYKNRIFMGYCCVCCEVMYLVVYAGKWPQLMQFRIPGVSILPPAEVLKLAPGLVAYFSKDGLPFMTVLGLAAIPGLFTKQICNWVQLSNAADSLVEYDVIKGKVKSK